MEERYEKNAAEQTNGLQHSADRNIDERQAQGGTTEQVQAAAEMREAAAAAEQERLVAEAERAQPSRADQEQMRDMPMDQIDAKPVQLSAQNTDENNRAFAAGVGQDAGTQAERDAEAAYRRLRDEAAAAKKDSSEALQEAGKRAGEVLDEAKEKMGGALNSAKDTLGSAKEKAGEAFGDAKEKAGESLKDARERAGEAFGDAGKKAGEAFDDAKERASEAFGDAKEKAGDAYESLKNEARARTKDVRKDGKKRFARMKLVAGSFFANPQGTLTAVFHDPNKKAAWGFYWVMVALALLTGLFADGLGTGIAAAVSSAVGALIYPAITCIVANMRGNRAKMQDVFSVFWVKDLPVYVLQAVTAVLTLVNLWPLVLLVEGFSLILILILNYMATLAICENNSREALWTNSITNLIVIAAASIIASVLIFIVFGLLLGMMMRGGFDYNMIYSFVHEFL